MQAHRTCRREFKHSLDGYSNDFGQMNQTTNESFSNMNMEIQSVKIESLVMIACYSEKDKTCVEPTTLAKRNRWNQGETSS